MTRKSALQPSRLKAQGGQHFPDEACLGRGERGEWPDLHPGKSYPFGLATNAKKDTCGGGVAPTRNLESRVLLYIPG